MDVRVQIFKKRLFVQTAKRWKSALPYQGKDKNIMNIRRVEIIIILIVGLAVYGCAYVNVKTPYDSDLNRTELGSKKGTAEAYSLFWLFAWGDASYATAAKNGDITILRSADQEIFQILFGFYTRWRVVVYGD